MKIPRGKVSLPVAAVVLCTLAFAGLIFTADFHAIAGTPIFKLKSCSGENFTEKETQKPDAVEDDFVDEDKIEFDSHVCSIENGEWVFNASAKPFYTDESCSYLDEQIRCLRNGRPDKEYLYWQWQLDGCMMPRFNATVLLEKLRGKRLMFTGDSLQREQWQSLVCMVESHIPSEKKSMKRGRSHSVFMATDYNVTIEFYWAPFLIESNSDEPIIADTKKRIIRLDSISKHAQHWAGVDVLVFNSYVWWTSDPRMKSLWGSFANGEGGFEELDSILAYRMAIKTWANWVDSNLNQNTTRVFFTTASPTHMRSTDWKGERGTLCYNETKPVRERGYWGTGSNKRMMEVVSSVVGRMRFPVTFLNITQLSEYRKDGHASFYTKPRGLSSEQPGAQTIGDCIHWCLPGIPDTWNQILYSYL
ncbi:hypothetical protein HPP92_006764 [Vanilla planifolia]|uniref:Trichome birefringence-like N-terminal domain-containing protein n=1 Tax=Vanilla planifolia TaxID=51239 RepID=A0A835RKI6_VANPL|nr:hypothetical protein HPP92_006764 [Vanilla planifolia]